MYSVKFSPDGQLLASASFDKQICMCRIISSLKSIKRSSLSFTHRFVTVLWRVYGTCENFLVLKGHKNAVLEVAWSADGRYI